MRVVCCPGRPLAGLVAVALGVVLWAGGPAWAQDETRAEIAMQNQILELRHDLDGLRDQVAAGGTAGEAPAGRFQSGQSQSGQSQSGSSQSGAASGGAGGDIAATLLDRVSQLEEQVRSLQGAVDELRNGLQKQNQDLSKQIGDLTFRVQTLEGGAAAGGAPTPGGAGAGLGAGVSKGGGDGSDDADPASVPRPVPAVPAAGRPGLPQGYAALARRDYPAAEAAARATLAQPHAVHGYDAQFLLAQALAGEHAYQQAALAYDDSYKSQRRGVHAQDALVGLAASLSALGAKPAACATLDKLHAEFPAARADVRASAASIERRAACR